MKLIVITSEEFFEGESRTVNLLFENGLEVLHLRKPCASVDETRLFVEQIDANFHHRIVLHDCYELADAFNLKGIHLNRRNIDVLQGKQMSVSRSCHSFDEVASSRNCDYVFLSPIFDSISKVGYNRGFTSEQLCEARDKGIINEKVMALGGVTIEKIPLLCQYGFGGVVVLGTLWSDFLKDGNVDGLLRRFNELNIKCKEI